MSKVVPALIAVMAFALAGCTDKAPAADPTPAVSTSAPAASAEPSTTSSPSGEASPSVSLEECMSGTYKLARFVSLGGAQAYGTGEGGDVKVSIDRGSYVMTGAGRKPIKLTLAAQQAQMIVDGTVKGSLTTDGLRATFTVDSTSGTATLRSGVQQQKLTMQQVASVLAPDGAAVLTCSPTKLMMVFDDIRLDLER